MSNDPSKHLEDWVIRLAEGLARLEDKHALLRADLIADATARFEEGQKRLHADLMARFDRLDAAVGRMHDDIARFQSR